MRLAMNKLGYAAIVLLGLLAIAEGLWIWQINSDPGMAAITLDATNAGIELDAGDGQVIVHSAANGRGIAAQGELGQTLNLPPGTYDAHVIFTRARDRQSLWLRDLKLGRGQRITRSVEFNSGELNVEVTQSVEEGQVIAYVFRHGDHDRVVTSMPSGEPVLVAPGVYDVRVVLVQESEETEIHWREQVPVKPGLQTRINVPIHRGSLLLRALNGEDELPEGAVELAVYRAGDSALELLETGVAGTPLGLAIGNYDVAATFIASHDRPVQWLRNVAIEDGQTRNERVEFSSGTFAITAKLSDGKVLERFHSYVYFYPAGEHREPLAYVTPPDSAVLSSGQYDLRVNFFRSHDKPDLWIRDLSLPVNAVVSRTVEFPSGKLLLRAYDSSGNELIGDTVFVHVHASGAHERPVTVARSGQIITLTAGSYDLRVEDSRRLEQQQWLEKVEIRSGHLTQRSVEY